VTYNPVFKVTIIHCQITRNGYNIELYIEWLTNRKWYLFYRTALFPMTLNNPFPQCQGHVIKTESLRNSTRYIVSMEY